MAEAEMELKYDPGECTPRHGRWYGWSDSYGGYDTICCDRPVGKETFELQQRLSRLESENSLLRSEMDSEKKMIEVYKDLNKKIGENEKEDRIHWEKQLVHNGGQDTRLALLESKVHQLYGTADLYINAARVSPRPMERYNNWEIPIAENPQV